MTTATETTTTEDRADRNLRRLVITDPYVLSLVERCRRQTGDNSASRTAGRIIQIAIGLGLKLDPAGLGENTSAIHPN